MEKEKIEEKVNQALGKTSALFMTQECKGTEIIMPTKELVENVVFGGGGSKKEETTKRDIPVVEDDEEIDVNDIPF
jgi:hypothetical protein